MYRLICQKPAHFLSAQMALLNTFFQMFIVLGSTSTWDVNLCFEGEKRWAITSDWSRHDFAMFGHWLLESGPDMKQCFDFPLYNWKLLHTRVSKERDVSLSLCPRTKILPRPWTRTGAKIPGQTPPTENYKFLFHLIVTIILKNPPQFKNLHFFLSCHNNVKYSMHIDACLQPVTNTFFAICSFSRFFKC